MNPVKDDDPRAAELDAAFRAAFPPKPETMAEQDLRVAIRAECERLGLRIYEVPRPAAGGVRGTGRGWPDLTIGGKGGVLFRECKNQYNDTRPEQDMWGWYLRKAGCDWAVWRPADWDSGRVRAELEAIR
jgi:hypothetical protein